MKLFSTRLAKPGSILVLAFILSASFAESSVAQQATYPNSPSPDFGTFEQPFSARSYWNSRPVGVQLGQFQIPDSYYRPLVGQGPYSSSAFLANVNDPPMRVYGAAGKPGLWELDGEQFVDTITIPRWPAGTSPATGSDGHADIVDPVDNVIHSFLNLKKDVNGVWTASMYAWTRLDGRGWGEPSHYFQGARAAAVPPMAGLIRKHEVNDGKPLYHHALAVSLTFNSLSGKTGYVFPATSADTTWSHNSGEIPEGALLMLPGSFDVATIDDPALKKVAETLKVYGAYVVDRNHGTPFYVYVENNADFSFSKNKWSKSIDQDLKNIQQGLRQVVSVQGWVDGHGQPFTPEETLNLLSVRGPWERTKGKGRARYDTWTQSLLIEGGSRRSEFKNSGDANFTRVNWAKLQAGQKYIMQVDSTEDIEMRLQIFEAQGTRVLFTSHWLCNGDKLEFLWPHEPGRSVLKVRKTSSNSQDGRLKASVYPVDKQVSHPLTATSTAPR